MISVVTSYYNRKVLFERTLKSLQKQNFDGEFEVIAVDDGSDDAERLEDLQMIYSFLKVVRLEKVDKWYHNSCIPFNLGFKTAKGDKIIIQNPECLHYADILEFTKNNLNDKNYLSFSCFSLDKITTDNFEKIFNAEYFIELKKNHPFSPKNNGESGWYNHSVYRNNAYHFGAAITKKNLEKLGGFDERFAFGIGCDDDEFISRVKKLLTIEFVDDYSLLHQNHYNPSSKSYDNRENKELLIKKNKDLFSNKLNYINPNRFSKMFMGESKQRFLLVTLQFEKMFKNLQTFKRKIFNRNN